MDLGGLVQTLFSKKVPQPREDMFYAKEPNFNSDMFNTPLPVGKEIEYSNWKAVNAPNDSGYDYDLQGAFLAGLSRDAATGHMSDQFKKPNHPTFSTQSQYAVGRWAKYAGTWQGDTYKPAKMFR